jgi:adenine-specific DNA-methyltransferase
VQIWIGFGVAPERPSWAESARQTVAYAPWRPALLDPDVLRKQWQQELIDKFFLPGVVVDGSTFKAKGAPQNPLDRTDMVVIASYQFVASKRAEVAAIPWDLVVIDEAHRLRNVYKTGSSQSRAILSAVSGRHKVLLTATPLQNSLLELYGLVSVADQRVFGDVASFREQFMKSSDEEVRNHGLREPLKLVCHRTLRRQVLQYVRFTKRIAITQAFSPSDDEQALYDQVSAYLQRANLIALPTQQRALMTMILRKLLASSSFAIGNTLRALVSRLEDAAPQATDTATITADYEESDEVAEEWEDEGAEDATPGDGTAIAEEIRILKDAIRRADGIATNAKGEALIDALGLAFDKAAELGAQLKSFRHSPLRRNRSHFLVGRARSSRPPRQRYPAPAWSASASLPASHHGSSRAGPCRRRTTFLQSFSDLPDSSR